MGDGAISAEHATVVAENLSEADSKAPSATAYLWATLIARIYEVFPLVCPRCGGELKMVAFVTEADPIQRILIYIGEPATPPRIAPARAPPDWLEADFDQTILDEAEPVPDFEFDQTVSWTISRVHFSVAVPITQWDRHRRLFAFDTAIDYSAVVSTAEWSKKVSLSPISPRTTLS